MRASRIAEFVREAGYPEDTPLAVGVSRRSHEPLFFAQGAGQGTTRFGPQSVAYAASVSKQLTGACAAMLERDGLLDRETRIIEWLPELPGWSERVRVRHLIHHTAGLPKCGRGWSRPGSRAGTSPDVLAALTETPQLEHDPGTAYAYSNEGYICLALIIERMSGSSLETFARRRIFGPLGMTSSIFWVGPQPAPPTAAATPGPEHPAALSVGDGGLWTSVRDCLRGMPRSSRMPSGLRRGRIRRVASMTARRSTTPGECGSTRPQENRSRATAGLRHRHGQARPPS